MLKKSKITFSSNPTNIESNDIFAKFKNNNWSNAMKPITTNTTSNSSLFQTMQKIEPKANPQQSTSNIEQDTFVKKDKNKIAKKVAIGTSLALVAYSAFALIKYRKHYGGFFSKLVEPFKVIKARINPNGFKPSVTIEENEIKYLSELFKHICRLPKKQQDRFVNNLYSKSTQKVKDALLRHFDNVINR